MVMVDEEKLSPEEKLLKAVEGGVGKKPPEPQIPPASDPESTVPAEQPPPEKNVEVPVGEQAQTESEKKPATVKITEPEITPTWSEKPVETVGWFKKIRQGFEFKIQELQERKLLPRFSFLRFFSGWRFDLVFVNRLIAIAAVILGLYMIVDFLLFRPEIPITVRTGTAAALPDVLFQTAQARSLKEYAKLSEDRNIFKPYVPKPTPEAAQSDQAGPTAAGGTGNFKIVAIASTGAGFEAILEDQNLKQTYFLKQGDTVQDYYVESIQWNTLILKKGDQKWDIH